MNDNIKLTKNQLTTDNESCDPGSSCWDPEFDAILQSFENGSDLKIIDKELEIDRCGKIINVSSNSGIYGTESTGISHGIFAYDAIDAQLKINVSNEDVINDEKLKEKRINALASALELKYSAPQRRKKRYKALINDELIQQYVEYAKCYAQYIGLSLDSTATICCGNPITLCWDITTYYTAVSKLEEIENRLNIYKNECFTAVWIWAEKTPDTEYLIHIGGRNRIIVKNDKTYQIETDFEKIITDKKGKETANE